MRRLNMHSVGLSFSFFFWVWGRLGGGFYFWVCSQYMFQLCCHQIPKNVQVPNAFLKTFPIAPRFSDNSTFMYISMASAISPIVTTSWTEFSFQNLVFLSKFIWIFSGTNHLKHQYLPPSSNHTTIKTHHHNCVLPTYPLCKSKGLSFLQTRF